jgi:hypothetical protein
MREVSATAEISSFFVIGLILLLDRRESPAGAGAAGNSSQSKAKASQRCSKPAPLKGFQQVAGVDRFAARGLGAKLTG